MSLPVSGRLSAPAAATRAQAALAELDAAEPNRSPAQLMGGEKTWDHLLTQLEMDRDPGNAPALRPHVVAPCQQLRFQPALRLWGSCGHPLGYLALVSMVGVLAVGSPRLLPPELRRGGAGDLASPNPDDGPEVEWTYDEWDRTMRRRAGGVRTSWQPDVHPLGPNIGIMGDVAKRQTFECRRCGAPETFRNVPLLRLVLHTLAACERSVRAGRRAGRGAVQS
jgi:hypothetical protein